MNLENTCTLYGAGFVCPLKAGDQVLVDDVKGMTGTIEGRSGRMLRIKMGGRVIVRDQAKVHKV